MSTPEEITNLQALIEYANSIDPERLKRWINCSHILATFNPFMPVTVQGIGKLDAKLIVEDEKIINKKHSGLFGDVSDHITISYLWVLGAYEIIRALAQRVREDQSFFPRFAPKIRELRNEFERIRIPLAKFEKAERFSETDSHIAYPGFHIELGTSWQVSEETWVNRRELSDKMLALFEAMKA